MTRTILLVTVAFLAGLGIGYYARRAGIGVPHKADPHAADLAAIEKLHKSDVAATLTQDPASLTSLWSDDGVNLGAAGTPVVGIKAMKEMYEQFRAGNPDFKVLNYVSDIKEIQIAGDWALEVGNVQATYKLSAKDAPVNVNDKGMRLLKRQSDGSWKFALVGLK
ncbi:MAG TPA: nuclear transport factor 2 family protein [Candidatus Acidoferrum sp.]|nr:nuclear transport factor 2 family protein [Candidatus Acidoferrum sp.]